MIMVCLGMSLYAQTNPNRLLVRDKLGNVKGFLAERVDSVFFARQEGRVSAEVEFGGYNADDGTVTVNVTRTSRCEAFRIECFPKSAIAHLTSSDAIANYLDSRNTPLYYEDFSGGIMSDFDFEFQDGTEYSILTVGYDQYGIACSVSRADFTTPRKPLVGNPSVDVQVKATGNDYITMSFTPNGDVKGYAMCIFEKGQAEAQFDMFAPMFGFSSMGDMIKQFSIYTYDSYYENTWTDLDPGKEYEMYVQAWDVNGTYADMIVTPAATVAQGGTGQAEVSISVGDFGGDALTGYYQWVTFTPNDQVSLYRGMIISKSLFETPEWGESGVLDYLKTDNPEDPYWDMYGTDRSQWNVEAGTDYLVFAVGRNINGEWGPLSRSDFSTPAAASPGVSAKGLCPKIKRGVTSYKSQMLRMSLKARGTGTRLTHKEEK